ncbi:hypothetical protein, conserved [Babesia bigemina]|uniref:Uncharacterized protein n=1 Tax=Babesia bigemina TaxID=5866 RepID=A0A061D021_BABBI|nr:hypothetical protein, conserved [Babesia bigemina]CDR94018.1 hypothetical protein, conserved [Babesia bigemina]|eukprot:XP_012766204.1 hypothetical protein, conserved [Babesia bigemina]
MCAEMNQEANKERATSGHSDWYQQFYVHECDAECFFSSICHLLFYMSALIVGLQWFCERLRYSSPATVKTITQDIQECLLMLGRMLTSNEYVSIAVARCRAELLRYSHVISRFAPQLEPLRELVAAYNKNENWQLLVALITLAVAYSVCLWFLRAVTDYLRERKMLYFCVNMQPAGAANRGLYTRLMVEKLKNTPEFRRLKQQRMHQGPEAWNWQTRQRMGEPMPSDDMSDVEF